MALPKPIGAFTKNEAFQYIERRLFGMGDIVKIAYPYKTIEHIFWPNSFTSEMDEFVNDGRLYAIQDVRSNGISLMGIPFVWPPWMLQLCDMGGDPIHRRIMLDEDEKQLFSYYLIPHTLKSKHKMESAVEHIVPQRPREQRIPRPRRIFDIPDFVLHGDDRERGR